MGAQELPLPDRITELRLRPSGVYYEAPLKNPEGNLKMKRDSGTETDYLFTDDELDKLDDAYLDFYDIPKLPTLGAWCARIEQGCSDSEQKATD